MTSQILPHCPSTALCLKKVHHMTVQCNRSKYVPCRIVLEMPFNHHSVAPTMFCSQTVQIHSYLSMSYKLLTSGHVQFK